MAMLDIIKKAGIGAVNASNPVNLLFGTVTKANPLEVNVDQRFTLTEDFLVVTEQLTAYEIDLKHDHAYEDATDTGSLTKTTEPALPEKIVIRKGLEAGDQVVLLRMQGGQSYIVLDRVVSL